MNVAVPKRLIVPLFLQWMNFSSDPRGNAIFQAILTELTVFAWELYYGRQSGYRVGHVLGGFGGEPDDIAEYCIENIRQFGGENVTASISEFAGNIYVWTHFDTPKPKIRCNIHLMIEPSKKPPVQVRWS